MRGWGHLFATVSLLQRLKTETRPHHERTEAAVRLMEPGLTPGDYRRHLEALHGFYVPLEAALAARLEAAEPALRAHERWKVSLLEEDLRALGHDAASLARLPRCEQLPALPGVPEALGCFYVLEGSTLGGQLILRHLRRHFAGVPVGDFAFFRAYGEDVGPMWRAFGEALTHTAARAASGDFDTRVVKGAQDTFDAFGAWLTRETGHASVRP
ncbi:biliverdin-producing heme oxygenase [Pyxidicoccus xibeiensis]|uniref:biliverdin-producing heme oxygenase n=1 Tax=Pyxidicoccus xibeiensis TaxID=2906759 RepID=UPI0020A6FD69|nr:biliverdin-producing heme oxygenase [Pyxidicoccus xibeiensis]MCP3135737.1 biliverdin-producing heme oxygenase [Pyxidicoccus xibeiensis]